MAKGPSRAGVSLYGGSNKKKKKKWRTQEDSMNARRKRNGVSFSREIASQISRENYPIVFRGRHGRRLLPPPLSSFSLLTPSPTAATSYFIPWLHNRLFVSRFYPRCGSQPPPAPTPMPTPGRTRAATFLYPDGI